MELRRAAIAIACVDLKESIFRNGGVCRGGEIFGEVQLPERGHFADRHASGHHAVAAGRAQGKPIPPLSRQAGFSGSLKQPRFAPRF